VSGPILPESVDLVHPFMQDSHDPDGIVRQEAPIDIMAFLPAIEAIDAQFRRDVPPDATSCGDILEPREQATDIIFGLILPSAFAGIEKDVVDPPSRSLLHAIDSHALNGGRYGR
jgi:hypothetical protein